MAPEKVRSTGWTKEQEKGFENALAMHPKDSLYQWENVTAAVSGKSKEELKGHYKLLAEDANMMEPGNVPMPFHEPSPKDSTSNGAEKEIRKNWRSKGKGWTEEEHLLFLQGLKEHGKGAWKCISQEFVKSRNPTQVASHAQKYFIRLNSKTNKRRRSSILDITSVDPPDASLLQVQTAGYNYSQPSQTLAAAAAAVSVPGTVDSYGITTGKRAFGENSSLTSAPIPKLLEEDVADFISQLSMPSDEDMFPQLYPQMYKCYPWFL